MSCLQWRSAIAQLDPPFLLEMVSRDGVIAIDASTQ